MPAACKFAVFDIDGTLIRWQLYHAMADELVRAGHLDGKAYEVVRAARMTWKKRANQSSFKDYEEALVKLVYGALSHIKASDVELASQHVIAEYQDQVYTYTRDLLKDLRAKDYLLFAISASPAQLVGLIAEHYGFDDFRGSVYGVRDDSFTGEFDVLLRARKPEKLRELVAEHHAVWNGSIAVGDSESDIPMLEVVEQPIAFNPTHELFEHAQIKGWRVVVERKNMVYELESRNGSYLLA